METKEIMDLGEARSKDSHETKGLGEKEATPPLSHTSAHQSQVTHPILFGMLNGITDAFLHVCRPLHHMLGLFIYPGKTHKDNL